MVIKTTAKGLAAMQPAVRRGYFECRYGQLHVYNSMPPGGGFEEGTALICLHESALTGRMFDAVLRLFGSSRSVYAPDLPGCGESDAPATAPTIEDYAAAVGDFLDAMRLRQIDVLGCQTGALIAAQLAISRPTQVRRVVWSTVPLLNDAERESFLHVPAPPRAEGSHIAEEWRRQAGQGAVPMPLAILARRVAETLYNGAYAFWAMNAAARYPARDRLSRLTQPLLVLRPKDTLWEATGRVRELLPHARVVEFPEQGAGLCEVAPALVVAALTDFLGS